MNFLKVRAAAIVGLVAVVGCSDDTTRVGIPTTTDTLTATDSADSTTSSETTTDTTTDTTGTTSSTSTDTTSSTSTDTASTTSTDTTTSTCAAGQIACGIECIDPQTNHEYCGATNSCTGTEAGDLCAPEEICIGGSCTCPVGFVRCGDKCINPETNANNCGAVADCVGSNAGDTCESNESCNMGKCEIGCPIPGQVACGSSCIDPEKNILHCGATDDCKGANEGVQCKNGEVCVEGKCAITCSNGEIVCDGECINPWNTPGYCGATDDCLGDNAGTACVAPEVCSEGKCSLHCISGQLECDGVCVDPDTDEKYCGATDCANGNKGMLCADGLVCKKGICDAGGCGPINFEVDLPPSDVLLVLDESGSMKWNFAGMTTNTINDRRWAALHDTVKSLVNDYNAQARFGVHLYPQVPSPLTGDDKTDYCSVPVNPQIPISDSSNAALAADLAKVNPPSIVPVRSFNVEGATPTLDALHNAVASQRKNGSTNPKAIILLSDGAISNSDRDENGNLVLNCYPGFDAINATYAEADAANSAGFKLFTIGIGLNDSTQTFLRTIATRGGDANRFVNVTNAAKLKEAFETALSKISSCVIPLEPAPDHHEHVSVSTSGGEGRWLFEYPNCAAALAAGIDRGFVYSRQSGPYNEIELCGNTCKEYKEEAAVNIQLGCPPPI